MRYCLLLIALYGAFLLGFRAYSQRLPTQFSVAAITSSHAHRPDWESPPSRICDQALAQPYTYLAQGGQSFVFVSQDGNYVIKFFKQVLYTPPRWLKALPPYLFRNYCKKKLAKKTDKFERDFRSYHLSCDPLADYTGVLLAHLNPSSHLQTTLVVHDEKGKAHRIDLDHYDFLLQRRAQPLIPTLATLEREGNFDAISRVFDAVFSLVHACHEKGIYDRDPALPANCGYLEGRAITMDVGRFMPLLDAAKSPELFAYACSSLEKALSQQLPELLPLYHQSLARSNR